MKNYYSSLARSKMIEAQSALEKADEYLAIASRDKNMDFGFRKTLSTLKKKLAGELERLANVMADKDLSDSEEN